MSTNTRSSTRRRRLTLAAALVAVLCGTATPPAVAATFTAHDAASLASALASANAQAGPSTVELRAGTYYPDSTLTIRGDVALVGPSGGGQAEILGEAMTQTGTDLFVVGASAHASFVNVVITDAGYQGVADVINVYGAADLENSTLGGNNGPALMVEVGARATVRNSTVTDGLDAGLVDDGSATLTNATLAGNAREGIDDRNGKLALVNTIVAGNGVADCSGHATSSDHSLDGDGSCGVGALSHVNPLLGPVLGSNGGPTPTRALAPSSPAIGAGDPALCPAEDQRHYARPAGRCDIGAYQTAAVAPTPGSAGAGGAAGALGSHRRVPIEIAGHGSLRAGRASRISFSVRARIRAPHGSFSYHDTGAGVWLKATSIASVTIDGARGIATIAGVGKDRISRRRLRFDAIITDRGATRRVRIRLSTGYVRDSPLVRGALALIYDRSASPRSSAGRPAGAAG